MDSLNRRSNTASTPEMGNHFEAAQTYGQTPASEQSNEPKMLEVKTYDIHDVLRGTGTPLRIGDLQWLIGNQAALHGCAAVQDGAALSQYILKHGSTFRGFVLHAEGKMPVAYAVYYQTLDEKGDKVAYCEDFYINDSFRHQGVAKILFQELAARTLQDNCKYLQWATDGRNQQVIDFVSKKLGAKTPEEIGKLTISANELLDKEHRQTLFSGILDRTYEPRKSPYETVALTPNDLPDLHKVGLGHGIIDGAGALPFKGYITRLKVKDPNVTHQPILAVTPGWIHFSTFQIKEGLHLESPSFVPGLSDDVKTDVMLSVLEAATSFRKNNQTQPHNNHVRWHINTNDEFMATLLQQKLGLRVDTMTADPQSHLMVFQLENGNLRKMAESQPARYVIDKTVFSYHPEHKPANGHKLGSQPS